MILGRVVYHFVPDYVGTGLRAMLFDVMPKVGQAFMPAGHKHLDYSFKSITHGAEEFMLRTHAAAMLAGVVLVRVDFSLHCMFGAKLKDLGGLVVDKGDGVEKSHTS